MPIGTSEYKASLSGWLTRAAALNQGGGLVHTAERMGAPAGVVEEIKAVVSAGDTSGLPQLTGTGAAFAAFARQASANSAFMALWNDGVFQALPFQTRLVSLANDISASVVAEGAPIPLALPTFDGVTLQSEDAAVIISFTDEILRDVSGAGQAFVNLMLRKAVGRVADQRLIDALTHGSTPTYTAAAADGDAVRQAVSSAFSYVRTTAGTSLRWIASPTALNGLLSAQHDPRLDATGGQLAGVPIAQTDVLPAGTLALVDGLRVAANIEGLSIRTSREATLQMRDDPISGATSLVSLFQTGSSAAKAVLTYGMLRLDDTAAAFVELA